MLRICLSFGRNWFCRVNRFKQLLLAAVMTLVCIALHAQQQEIVQGVVKQDYEVLAAIYEALGGRFWTSENIETPYPRCYFTDWMTFVQVTDWYGVTVENNRVVKLILVNNRLYDQLPDAIGNLTALRELVLKNNAIHGAIPATITNIKTLEKLDLSYNHFDQPVPPGIFALPNLKELILNDNHIPGPFTITQPATTSLQKLRMENNVITGALPYNIGALRQLKLLRLSNNEISGSIPASFKNLTLLDSVYIQYNDISAINPAYLKTSYHIFDCSNNAFNFGDLVPLNVTQKLWLKYAPQKDLDSIRVIGKQAGNSYTLQGIDYQANNKYEWYRWSYINNDTAWQKVGTGSNHVLSSLNKNSDEATYRCVITNNSVPNLELYTKPVHIYVDYDRSKNDLDERYYIELAKFFLSTNGLPWKGIYNGWKGRTKWLNSIVYVGNWYGISGGNTWRLGVSKNGLYGVLPDSFRILTEKFTYLDLSDNSISGKLPEHIEDMGYFWFARNNLTGKISASFFNNKISSLILNHNNLYGELPSNIFIDDYWYMYKYIQIWLDENNFYGKIPQWQVDCAFSLTLNNNDLSGAIPKIIFKNLEYITCSNNYLTGWDAEIFDSIFWTCWLPNNNISGDLSINHIGNNLYINLNHNYIDKLMINCDNLTSSELSIDNNNLTFEPLRHIQNSNIHYTLPRDQRHFGKTKRILCPEGSNLIYNLDIDNNITNNTYSWYKYNASYTDSTLEYQSSINKLVINNITADQQGVYFCLDTNSLWYGMTLRSRPILITMVDCEYLQSEIDVLLELRYTNGGISTQQWDIYTNPNVSSWPGVTVENCHVTAIHLPNEGLTGVLPQSLCSLEYLESVDFSGNPGLLSPVPSCVCQLMNLYYDVTISRTGTELVCPGGSIVLQASVANANSANFRYRWYSPSGNLLGTVTGSPLFEIDHVTTATLGEYRVDAEPLPDELPCGGSGTYTIDASIFKEYPTVTISRPNPTLICPGESIVLKASVANANPANFRYHWYSPSGDLLGTVTGDPLFEVYHISAATLGEYRVDAEPLPDELSCGGSGSYTINGSVFRPLPVITRVGSSPICSGGSVTLRASVAGINPDDLTYRWYNSSGKLLKTATADPLIELTNVTAASMGKYRVEVESLSGLACGSGGYTLKVSFYSLPTVSVTNILHTTCADSQDGSANITVTGTDAAYTYLIFNAAGIIQDAAINYVSGEVFTASKLPVGVYTISGATSAGCTYTQTFEIKNGGPVVELCLPPLPCDVINGQTVPLTVQFRVTRLRATTNIGFSYSIFDGIGKLPPPVSASYNVMVTHKLNYVHGRNYTLVLNDCNLQIPLNIEPLNMSIGGVKAEYRRCYPSQPLNITGNIRLSFPRCLSINYKYDGLIRLYSVSESGVLTLLQTQSTQDQSVNLTNFIYPAGKYLLRVAGTVMFMDAGYINYSNCIAEHYFSVTSNDLLVEVDMTNESCAGEKNGSATARVSGGTPPYEYFWYRGATLISKGATVNGLAPGDYTLRVKDALPCDISAGATSFTIFPPAPTMKEITVKVPNANSPDCAVTATVGVPTHLKGKRYRFEWIRIVPSQDPTLPAQEVTVFTDDVTASLYDAVSTTNLNIIRPGFEYYIVVTDSRGCRKSTRGENKPGMVVRPAVQRDYAMYFRWKSKEEIADNPPASPAVNDRAVVAASEIKRKFEEAPLECATNAELKAEMRFGDYCTAIEHLHDELEIKYRTRAGHFTLYYYDRAGNLSKTVPPAGVRPCVNPASWSGHTMVTEYRHNTLGQVVWQRTPDSGESQFLYDGAGRLRFSQNAQQALDNKFSYTKYDELGRPRETGQGTFGRQGIVYRNWNELVAANSGLYATEQNLPLEQRFPASTVAEPVVEYRTITRYDEKGSTWNRRPQRYTLNRISSVEHRNPESFDIAGNSIPYEPVTTRYSYDPHGNVEWTTTDIPGMGARGTEYEYDLVSGNVTQVAYDRGYIDQFFHRYEYDEDNRLIKVQTSDNGDRWETDASYSYYAHGPLRRTEVGNDRLQGVDYVYTLQGWLKAINHPQGQDPGNDGISTPRDLFGMALNYYNGDYKNSFLSIQNGTLTSNASRQLYNGNIAAWMWRTPAPDGLGGYTDNNFWGQLFTYDRLNRIRTSRYYTFNTGTSNWLSTTRFYSAYSYDANGNILTMNRYEAKNGQPVQMDNLRYLYQSGANKLGYVTDIVGAGEFDHDVDEQNKENYSYDASGNLILDQSERIRKIEWTPSGKVKRIVKEKAIKDLSIMITFLYDAAGNRVAKKFTNIDTHTEIGTMFYVPDAQGNIMATYNRTITYNLMLQPLDINYWLVEQPVYSSGRLGIRSGTNYLVRRVSYGQFGRVTDYRTTYAGLTTRTIGRKQYELTDHLGNIRVVFDDRITGTLRPNTLKPQIIATNSYYPYGMLIKSLSQNSEVYRWGFQGHEQDNEIKGIGNHLRFGDYGYDTRLGRRWNLDPVDQIGISNYAVFGDNPVNFIDPNGRKIVDANGNIITYSADKGWSKNATTDIQTVYRALMLTKTGKEQWEKAYKSNSKIEIKLVQDVLKYGTGNAFGDTNKPLKINKKTGKVRKTTDPMQIRISTVTIESSFDDENAGLTMLEAIGATVGHEIEHTTDENIDITVHNLNTKKKEEKKDVEKKPTEIGSKIREESRKLHERLPSIEVDFSVKSQIPDKL